MHAYIVMIMNVDIVFGVNVFDITVDPEKEEDIIQLVRASIPSWGTHDINIKVKIRYISSYRSTY